MANDQGRLLVTKGQRGPVAAAAVAGMVMAWKSIEYLSRAVSPAAGNQAAELREPEIAPAPAPADDGASVASFGPAHQAAIDATAARGRQIYGKLEERLKAEFLYKCVCINVETEEYVVGGSFPEAHGRFCERFGDAPSWDTRIGEAPYVFGGGGLLQ